MDLEFSINEYESRLVRAQDLMQERALDALFLTTYANFRYFTGHTTHRWMQTTAPQFAIVPRDGRPVAVLAAIEQGRAVHNPWLADIRSLHGYDRVGVGELADTFADLRLETGRIGAELESLFRLAMPASDFEALKDRLPKANFVDASELLWELRMIKSASEIAYIRSANQITDKALGDLYATAAPGMTEKELFQVMVQSLMAHGADWP